MAVPGPDGEKSVENPRRISVSLETLREEIRVGVENALLKLQLDLVRTYATKDETTQLTADLRRVFDSHGAQITALSSKVDALETDKAGRDAVQNFKKWLTGGALLATVFMAIQVAISLWLVTRG